MLELIYGFHPVSNALKNHRVKTLILLSGTEPASALLPYIKRVSIDYRDKTFFAKKFLAATHQNIAAICNPLSFYDEALLKIPPAQGLYLLLDSVTDPRNFGACVRSAVFYGCDGIIFTKRNRAPLNSVCCKAAAGMIEWIKLIQVSNALQALRLLKGRGYWVLAMDGRAEQTLPLAQCVPPLVVVVGSEGKGIRQLLMKSSDYRCRLPTQSDFSSLNVSVATALGLSLVRAQQGWFNLSSN